MTKKKKKKNLLHLKSNTEDYFIIEGKIWKICTQCYCYGEVKFATFQ